MPKEAVTPDLVQLTRRAVDALNRRDFDAVMSLLDPAAVWEGYNLPAIEGATAIRSFLEDWIGNYEYEYEYGLEEVHDLGSGVTFVVTRQRAGMPGSDSTIQELWASAPRRA